MTHKFTAQNKMIDVIDEDASLLTTLTRFGISFGFGNKTIEDACKSNNIDTETFLAVINFIAEGNMIMDDTVQHLSIETVISYLKNGHSYFISYKLPSLKTKLLEAVDASDQSIPYRQVFLRFFDEYVDEVRKHMEYEDQTVFPYVMQLLSGTQNPKYSISVFEDHHSDVDSKLAELKNILVKYYPSKGNNYRLNEVLFDLLLLEKDLVIHNMVEDYFFVPVVEAIEQNLRQ